ncbi:4Fe-4S binding protein [Aurantimonas sp. C2-6-R+9]|uniref:4Fe-4S binding protein n=1 Tax=unclassified Aurantimonas TaxID=2638230 RepID=UPI002E17AE68|nr:MULTISPECIES: 4Fe-4S binding protein [unclassified Aurantimonas]MEC5290928.1 4Fe-4S binding protein [Aurantimonas sp. C2-3-R2]MEC5381317.1 4Fe-4S binding protein [Aurantimonas sp. C2-6-R+9]MEC5412140.1 4Fe-4S binding protein [Aurantimonas sp. C2-4-R8]
MRLRQALIIFVMAFASPGLGDGALADGLLQVKSEEVAAKPDLALAARLFARDGPLALTREEGAVPGWSVTSPDGRIGWIVSTWEIAESVGYSGRPIDILVAVTRDGRIAGAQLIRQSEPVLTLGISASDIENYVDGFAGVDLTRQPTIDFADRPDLPDVISRATVSTGVIRDAILRTARTVALVQGRGAAIDRVSFRPASWDALLAEGALARTTVSLDAARAALSAAKMPPPPGEAPFLDLWIGLLDPPTIGKNLLGQALFTRAMAVLGPGETALFVASRGLHSHRGTAWRRSGVFDRIAVIQDEETITFDSGDYLRIDRLGAASAPDFKEMSVFRLPADRFDPALSFRVEVTASRDTGGEPVSMRIPVDYTLPARFLRPPEMAPETEPLWVSAWQRKRFEIIGVGLMLTTLAVILFLQEAFVRRPALWRWGRITFLTVTLVWLGWIAGGQLSVVQVVAFLQSLTTGFRWETFLIDPVIFMLWGFVALGLLFWGRGVYCGWLCPFGALQELTNEIAKRLRIPQIAVPFGVHERLWAIKYTAFVAILGLSFYSMDQALVLAEIEPFKTAMSMRFMRAWPFVLFVVALLVAGLFIERFYCRYLCPLGAALAIPAKLKLFDWLRRRPQCGRECRLCETKCMVGAIDPIGRINPNECVLCLHCQTIYHDSNTCLVLKRRARPTAPTARENSP